VAQAGNCDQFEVGTKAWTDCIHDSATGGGLMPWIVVIPLGVMVLGMMIGFARQFSAAGRQKAKEHGAAGTAGTWLIFVSFVELAIGAGSVVAARRATGGDVTGGYGTSATVLLGVGVVLFVIGVFLKIKGFRRKRIYHQGVPGEAIVRAVHETGTMVNNQPMYAFDLDVTGSGFPPTSTTHREVIPFWFLNRIGPDARIPVKVDPSNPSRLIFDWDRFRSEAPAGGAAATPAVAGLAESGAGAGGATSPGTGVDSLSEVMQMARQFTGAGGPAEWRVGKVIGLGVGLLVLVIVGAGLFVVARVLGNVGEVTDSVTDQVVDAREDVDRVLEDLDLGGGAGQGDATSTIEVSRSAAGRGPVGFSIAQPLSWLDLTASVQERQPPLVVDLVLKPQTPSEARIVVTRSVRFLADPAPAKADIGSIRREVLSEYGDSLAASRSARLDGEPAIRIDVVPGADGLRSRQVAVLRGGQVIFVSLTAQDDEWQSMLPVFEDVLSSWKWS
jgi:hypothetical protein